MTVMKAVVLESKQEGANSRALLELESGRALVFWHGTAPPPGETRFVELDVRDVISLGERLTVTSEPVGVTVLREETVFVGEVVESGEDGLVRLDTGKNQIEIEVSGSTPTVGQRCRLVASDILAFDCNY